MAILAHMLQIVGLWIAPLIIFVIKRESRFVSFHALQALLLQVLYMFLMGLGVVFWFGAVVLTMVSAHSSGNSSSPPAFFIFMPMLWLDWMSIWGAMVVIAIVSGSRLDAANGPSTRFWDDSPPDTQAPAGWGAGINDVAVPPGFPRDPA